MTGAPQIIYLQTEGADPTIDKTSMSWRDLYQSRISWSTSKVYDSDLMYQKVPTPRQYSETDMIEIGDNMRKYGGSFVQAIGHAISRADMTNKARLALAFPELFETYYNFAND